ncbi:MAG: acyl-CoA dehydrogenase family protein [candidate division WOR-3 bacterium]|nr:MAG: acyl-CoA dehydrogenase family protein [candidate division WOR-3 bacterium]
MSIIEMNSEQKLIRGEIRKFAAAELDPVVSDIEKNCRIPPEILAKISQMGLFGLTVPEQYGGSGLDTMTLCVALEELSRSSASLALMVAVNNCFVARSISEFASTQTKENYLKKISAGSIGCYVSYPETEITGYGFLVDSAGGGKFLSGRNDIALNGAVADFFIVPAKYGQSVVLCVLDKNESVVSAYPVRMMGMCGAGVTGLEVEHRDLKEEDLLMIAADGLRALRSLHDYARIGLSAIALGLNEAALDASVKYSKERKQFGRAICEFPMVRDMLSEIKVSIEKSRLLVYEAASRSDKNEDFSMLARVACLTSCEGAVLSGLKAIQIHGGYGYTRDYPVERYFRDAKTLQLLCGGPVDLRSMIAEEILS